MDPVKRNADAHIVALRENIEAWLVLRGEYLDASEDLPANNLTLWANLFIEVTSAEVDAAAERLRIEGALDFASRVTQSANNTYQLVPAADPNEVIACAFKLEVQRLDD